MGVLLRQDTGLGKTIYSKALGHTDIETKKNDLNVDSVMWIASMTKVCLLNAHITMRFWSLVKNSIHNLHHSPQYRPEIDC